MYVCMLVQGWSLFAEFIQCGDTCTWIYIYIYTYIYIYLYIYAQINIKKCAHIHAYSVHTHASVLTLRAHGSPRPSEQDLRQAGFRHSEWHGFPHPN